MPGMASPRMTKQPSRAPRLPTRRGALKPRKVPARGGLPRRKRLQKEAATARRLPTIRGRSGYRWPTSNGQLRPERRNSTANHKREGPEGGRRPIEIGLWVGSAASPNRLGKTGDGRRDTAVARVRRYRRDGREAPAPIKACPWCATPFSRDSFACIPTEREPRNMQIRCANPACVFTGNRSLPILTVDEVIYRRLPAFIIATVDKFAGLPWIAEAGAFFGHVDREDQWGFYGAADPCVAPGSRLRRSSTGTARRCFLRLG